MSSDLPMTPCLTSCDCAKSDEFGGFCSLGMGLVVFCVIAEALATGFRRPFHRDGESVISNSSKALNWCYFRPQSQKLRLRPKSQFRPSMLFALTALALNLSYCAAITNLWHLSPRARSFPRSVEFWRFLVDVSLDFSFTAGMERGRRFLMHVQPIPAMFA